LLSDPDTAKLLNTEFVPCWDTVRPVPQVTIDFGNGRILKRTLAGNTVISICAPDGRVLDAYPGVYTPAAFKAQIGDTLGLFRKLSASPAEQTMQLAAWHRERFLAGVQAEGRRTTLSKAFVESPLLSALGLAPVRAMSLGQAPAPPTVIEAPPASGAPGAGAAPRVLTTTSKAVVQSAILKGVASPTYTPLTPGVATAATAPGIDPLSDPKAAFGLFTARLEDVSKRAATVRELRRPAAGQQAPAKTPEQIGREAVEEDSAINIRTIRPAVHLWFMANGAPTDVRAVRDAMYRDLLHVPVDDPYLGLTDALIPGTPPGQSAK
jgi:hypothetical protein